MVVVLVDDDFEFGDTTFSIAPSSDRLTFEIAGVSLRFRSQVKPHSRRHSSYNLRRYMNAVLRALVPLLDRNPTDVQIWLDRSIDLSSFSCLVVLFGCTL